MGNSESRYRCGLSLVELMVVIVIFGIVAALAIPSLTHAATSSVEEELRSDLATLRIAIELYFDDHGAYPGARDASSSAPAGSAAAFELQLTQVTNRDGHVNADNHEGRQFGPYLRRGIPPCPVQSGARRSTVVLICGAAAPAGRSDTGDHGWVFNCDTGYIAANSDACDPSGARYDQY